MKTFANIKEWLKINIGFLLLLLVALISYIALQVILQLYGPLIKLNESQVLYFFSTAAQSIAGLLGLTLTAYTFLRNELDREAADDESVEDSVIALKKKYFLWIILMSFVGSFAIILSLINIAVEDDSRLYDYLSILFSTSGFLIFFEVLVIMFFAIDILNPRKLENITQLLKENLLGDTITQAGDFSNFLSNFNRIERVLQNFAREFGQPNSPKQFQLSNRRIAELLYQKEQISKELLLDLQKLIQYRNFTVHSSEIFVEKTMEQACIKIRIELEKLIDK
ncbi:hypothetical protein [Leptospira wolffii]|uniref:hypothetical protein n=1 Tax=Leptospira wolffii TaxID=409998 RepID=UPI0012EB8217|nr:hypothetical protein [Leptospira wolffii]